MWDRFGDAQFWWMHAVLMIWLIFAAMPFAIEPLFLPRRMARATRSDLLIAGAGVGGGRGLL